MATEADALSGFDFNKVSGPSVWLRFTAGKPVTLRVLTTDPVVVQDEFTNKDTGEIELNMKFAFIVYNFTDNQAQIMKASPSVARKIGDLHKDPDFGADVKKIDIKISPTGEKLERRYDIQVLPQARTLTAEQIKEARSIDLPERVKGYRMSQWDEMQKPKTPAVDAIEAAGLTSKQKDAGTFDDEPINIDDIPF